jgi:hypothetical protein
VLPTGVQGRKQCRRQSLPVELLLFRKLSRREEPVQQSQQPLMQLRLSAAVARCQSGIRKPAAVAPCENGRESQGIFPAPESHPFRHLRSPSFSLPPASLSGLQKRHRGGRIRGKWQKGVEQVGPRLKISRPGRCR